MGEIGIPRREFLHELKWWELKAIRRGYYRRDREKMRMMATCCWASLYSFRDPQGKTAADLFPQLFKDDDDNEATIMTKEDTDRLQQEMANMQAYLDEQWKDKHK